MGLECVLCTGKNFGYRDFGWFQMFSDKSANKEVVIIKKKTKEASMQYFRYSTVLQLNWISNDGCSEYLTLCEISHQCDSWGDIENVAVNCFGANAMQWHNDRLQGKEGDSQCSTSNLLLFPAKCFRSRSHIEFTFLPVITTKSLCCFITSISELSTGLLIIAIHPPHPLTPSTPIPPTLCYSVTLQSP